MKKTLLFLHLLFFISYTQLQAQKIRFTDSTNVWHVNSSWMTGWSFWIDKYHGDTIISGLKYRVSTFGFIREDTLNNKVLVRNFYNKFISTPDTNESILYDYNLKVGDTMIYNYVNPYGYWKYKVVALDSTYIDSIKYKIWYVDNLSANTTNQNFTIIEGIGSLCGPAFPMAPYTFEDYLQMYCFEHNNSHPLPQPPVIYSYFNPFFGFDNINSCNLSVSNTGRHMQPIIIAPNPANETSRVIFPYTIQLGKLSITNIMGQSVVERSISNEEQISIGKYLHAPGVYFFRITDNQNDKTFAGKFVYQ